MENNNNKKSRRLTKMISMLNNTIDRILESNETDDKIREMLLKIENLQKLIDAEIDYQKLKNANPKS